MGLGSSVFRFRLFRQYLRVEIFIWNSQVVFKTVLKVMQYLRSVLKPWISSVFKTVFQVSVYNRI